MHEALQLLLTDGVIDEVAARLKSGKEADVYIVTQGGQYVAAKIYKERSQRNFKNNAGYKEGRMVRNSRTQRAMDKGSRFGQAASEEEWKATESEALSKLFAAGVRVPAPVMFYEGVLLMELVVDTEGQPAPRLVDATFSNAEAAEDYYRDLRQQAVRMLCCDIIHGDLSAYNILLGAHGPTIIDFPQIVSAAANSRAEFFFNRDLENLRLFFSGFAPSLKGRTGDAAEIWKAYVRRELTPDFEPSGRAAPGFRGSRDGGRPGGQRPPREGGRPPFRDRRPAPVQEVAAAAPVPAPAPAEAEDEFALLRQGGGERPKVAQQSARNGKGGERPHRQGPGGPRGGPPNRSPGHRGHEPRSPGGAPHRPHEPRTPGGAPHRPHEPRPAGGPQHRSSEARSPGAKPAEAGASRPADARGFRGDRRSPSHGAGRSSGTPGGGRPPHAGPGGGRPAQAGQGPRNERSQAPRPGAGQGRRGASPAVSYVSRVNEPSADGSTEES
ncbi:RIO1 family regulatory kinase/ATPase [Stigmatella erecta]|uniref:non-specific serine/threonine protein kinase n=1 Tax=Stigmatella erecta TaxID=83460 RepID=A0A1I0KIM7_9BACT|nr:RIO1 family regulatory kinase/ATPase [Stigmatella erecta]SEU24727.1 RIO kinase 1 [Stigmatella erecta]